MDDEIITWSLKGPKRYKKRKELNALMKKGIKYKSLLNENSSELCFINTDSERNSKKKTLTLGNDSSSSEIKNFKGLLTENALNYKKYCKSQLTLY
jgi:hypothetical protein